MRTQRLLFGGIAAVCLAACGGAQSPKPPDLSGPITPRASSASGRERVSISVYNGNFGLVREVRRVPLAQGRVELEFQDVAEHIQPETVHIKALTGPPLTVLEQNYRYDLLTPNKLLEKYVGKKVKLYRYDEKTGKDEPFDAEVLAFNDGNPIFKIGGEITYGFPGRVAFPEIPKNLIAHPALVWLLGAGAPEQRVEVTYITQGLNWRSDYVLTVDDRDQVGDLVGWVTLTNQTGTTYENAELKLVAGDVQRVRQVMAKDAAGMDGEDDDRPARVQFREEGLFEYHLYTLQRPTSLLEKEQKQVSLLEAASIGLKKKLVFFGQQHWYRSQYGTIASNQKVGVFFDIENTEKNKMGMPLPKGVVRVYKADKSGAKQFIGEDHIDHTPRDEKFRIKMGDAFDVVGDRKQMAWTTLGSCASESDWEISLRNHKDTAEEVEVVEPVGGDWSIVSSSHQPVKKDAHTFVFTVPVGPRAEAKITYRVRVRWC